jgi:PAS domain S-box-containing protein
MKNQFRILISVVSSIAVSIVIALIAFSLLKGMNTELKRSRVYSDVLDKTHALNIMTASFKEGSNPSDIRQARGVLHSLDNLLNGISSRTHGEEVIVRQLQKNNQELTPLIDQMIGSGKDGTGGRERERRNILASQIWMKAGFISDDTNDLLNISRSRIIAAQEKTGAILIGLIFILALTNGGIYFLSGRSIVRSQKALQRSEERFRSVLDNSQDVIYRMDIQNGRFDYISPVAEMVVGYTPAELKAMDVETAEAMIHPDDRPAMWAALARLEETGHSDVEYRQRTKNGDYRWMSNRMSLIKVGSGQSQYRDGSIRDVTDRKRADEELRRSREELESRVQERTAELSMTISKLNQLNRELEEFTFVASHDLQEPLRKIETFGGMVKENCAALLDPTSRDHLDRVLRSANRMRQLLRELLKLSRVTTRKEPFNEIDLAQIVKEAADVFEVSIKETGGRIEINEMPVIEADSSQMGHLFQNLIGNALKFRDNKTPLIQVYGRVVDKGLCEISINDNGIGFDTQFAERIFKPFERLHSRSEYEGTGMGLAICRRIVERHGGTIKAESEPGKGSTFIIRLPLKQVRSEGN